MGQTDRGQMIESVVDVLKQCEQPEMPVTHYFSPGIYCRQIFMPALPGGGTYVIGHKHKTRHQNIILTGKATVTIGNDTLHIEAPFVFESAEGSQKLLTVTEDMLWITVHANPENIADIPTLESMIFELPDEIRDSGLELDQFRMNRNLSLNNPST